MKTSTLIICLLTSSVISYSQNGLKISADLTYGWGGISNGGQVQNYFDRVRADNQLIQNYTFTNKTGYIWGLGFGMSIYTRENFCIVTGLRFLSQTNNMIIDYKVITDQSNGSYDLIHSTDIIQVRSISLPLLLKKSFGTSSIRPFLQGGIEVEYRFQKYLSVNTEDFTHLDGSANSYSHQTGISMNKPLDGLTSVPVNYVFGLGLDYKVGEHMIGLSVNYKATFMRSALWVSDVYSGTSSGGFSGEVNKVFNYDKQKDISGNYGININDWKNSFVYLILSYTF